MKPETRTRNLLTLLGWQGGTVHDACREIGVDPHDFLYSPADFWDYGADGECRPCHDFRQGYEEAVDIATYMALRKGNLQYWLGAISAVNQELPQ